MLVDTHAHLTMPELARDLPGLIERARSAGVRSIVCVGIDLESSWTAIDDAHRFPEILAAVGVHPNDCADLVEDWPKRLRAMAANQRVVAIGEIGLDYFRQNTPHQLQREVFRKQLELAGELGLPVVVHDRAADADVTAELVAWSRELPASHPRGVLHCFSGDRAMLDTAVDAGFYISFAGPVTFVNGKAAAEMAQAAPWERLLVETDSPYLTPHPHRGEWNEPAMVKLIVRRVAELRGERVERTIEITGQNAARLFGPAISAAPAH